ncbi:MULTISPECIES: sugar-binding protein [Niastella]|uniref:Ig-like domain-containing protein n=1 Tax=Niastella soli TaxID=2821487 RepID=A0ABS3YW64_9BACT|nr:sugar-binding protein [Niastella soli]MBO9202176.1 Ig-like domain-containing protein [Niastella soli]
MKKIVSHIALLLACLAPFSLLAQSDGLPRGANNMPYTRYEAENGSLGGSASLQSSPQFIQTDIASEASNQKYVSLPANGSYVQWKTSAAARGVNLRFTMPDNSSGTGQTGSLNLYVNNTLVKTIDLSSYWAYQYFDVGGEGDPYQTPRTKTFMRFDEVHFTVTNTINAGDTIKIQKTNGDGLTYGVDFIELEPVPAAIGLPANYLSVTDYGAVANDANDDYAAFNACIAAAKTQAKNVYIPAGRFLLSDKLLLTVTNMKITGAGVWYTQVYFSTDKQFYGGIMGRSSGVEISNFTLGTANNDRLKYDEPNPRDGQKYKIYKGFMGTYGNGSSIHDIWVEHFECGFWIGGYDAPYPVDVTRNLTISNCRIRNNYADGVNFCIGTSSSTVTQCSLRNNGDDALAMWPASDVQGSVQERNNTFSNNTIENNWRAGSIAIFGGTGHQVHHNYIKDGVAGSGIRFTNDFAGFGFEYPGDVTHFYENTIENCGTSYDLWNQMRGAIEFFAGSGIFNMQFGNTTVLNSQRDAIRISGSNLHHIVFTNTTINGTGKDPVTRDIPADVYGGFGIYCDANSQGMTFNNLSVTDAESGTYINRNPSFQLVFQNVNVPVTSVSISPAGDTTLALNQSVQLTPVIVPADANNKTVSWSSSNPSVVTVDASGKITAVGTGSAIITVTTADGNKTATKNITVSPAVNIKATDETAGEGGNTGSFTISTAGITQAATIHYAVSGTATSGDYTASPALSGTVTLTPTQLSQTITISPVDDSQFEGAETVRITLLPGTGYKLGPDTVAVITIADNDNPPCTAPVIGLVNGTPPVIDQNIEAAWASAPATNINQIVLGSRPADYSGKWRALYDNNNLYLLVEINDATRLNDSGPSWWEDDVVEIFIDGNNSKGSSYDGLNDFQFGFRWNDNTVHTGGNSVANTTGINFRMYATGTGYTTEIAIPWTTIGATPAIGKALGLDIQIDDDDNGGSRDAQTTTFSTNTTAFQNPSVFGTVYMTSCNGNVNQPPVANAGADTTLSAGTTSFTLHGTGTDPEGNAVTYSWTQVSGPTVTISNANTANPALSGLTTGNTYVFQLTVSDGVLTATDNVAVGVLSSANVVHGYPAAGTITIDGVLSEAAWQLNNNATKNVIGTANNNVTFGVLWDNNNLYIAARVLDNTLNNDSPDPWNNDAIEIFIDANNNKLTNYDGLDNQFIKAWNNSSLFTKLSVSGVQHAWAAVSGGYAIELSIPWSQLGITPAAGKQIGFDIANDDDDNGGDRDAQAVWMGTINNYQNTSAFGTLVIENTAATLLSNLNVQNMRIATEGNLQVLPNPVSNGNATAIISGGSETGIVRVFDLAGHLVYITKGQGRIPLYLQTLPKGLYLVRFESGVRLINKRILIK